MLFCQEHEILFYAFAAGNVLSFDPPGDERKQV